MLCEIAILESPTIEDAKKGTLEKVLVAPYFEVAKDEKSAYLQAIKRHNAVIPDDDASRIQILVRSF